MSKYFGTSIDVVTGEETIVYLTPEEIAALPLPPTLEERNNYIAQRRAERYANEVDIYAIRYKRGEVDDVFIDGLYAKIKAELPYEVEAQEVKEV
jgi:hypothetical protein